MLSMNTRSKRLALSGDGRKPGSRGRQDYVHVDILTPKTFNVELVEAAIQRNTLIFSGDKQNYLTRIFIAVSVIRHFGRFVRNYKKISVFLSDEIEIMNAFEDMINVHSNLKVYRLMNFDNLTENINILGNYHVLITSPDQFLKMLQQEFFQLTNIFVLVLSEVKQILLKSNPYNSIMDNYKVIFNERPHILGLDESVLSVSCLDPKQLRQELNVLENILDCQTETATEEVYSDYYGARPNVQVHHCEPINSSNELFDQMIKIIIDVNKFFENISFTNEKIYHYSVINTAKIVFKECLNILQSLGTWCLSVVAESMLKQIWKLTKREKEETDKKLYLLIQTNLALLKTIGWRHFEENVLSLEDFQEMISPRVLQLIEILVKYEPTQKFIIESKSKNIVDDEDDYADNDDKEDEDYIDGQTNKKETNNLQKLSNSISSSSSIDFLSSDEDDLGSIDSEKQLPQYIAKLCDGENTHRDESLYCVVFSERRHSAFALNKLITELCNWHNRLFFVHCAYINDVKGEDIMRQFRLKSVNLLFATSSLPNSADLPKCNLVIQFDPPNDFKLFIQSKTKAQTNKSAYHILLDKNLNNDFPEKFEKFKDIEEILTCHLREKDDNNDDMNDEKVSQIIENLNKEDKSYYTERASVNLWTSTSLVNKYCAKLPSDSFTQLYASSTFQQCQDKKSYRCTLQLPINSPIKVPIYGSWLGSKKLARMSATLNCCRILHENGELDSNLMPIGKDLVRYTESQEDHLEWANNGNSNTARPGSNKRKQHYDKHTANLLNNSLLPDIGCCLYKINMLLTRQIDDAQNVRGRKIFNPERSSQSFGFFVKNCLPNSPHFPVFTRSGEVTVSFSLVSNKFLLNQNQLKALTDFHFSIFHKTLRLGKDPMTFKPFNSNNCLIIAPLIESDNNEILIDWDYMKKVEEFYNDKSTDHKKKHDGKEFQFDLQFFEDAVVMPSYRNKDQPQHFYVAEIRSDLSPKSQFPSESFSSFEEYYRIKYNLEITNLIQPLLDVDHTSVRLNLLTPRYVNQKGKALPTSSSETRRARRESLRQKQILVPELCLVHVVSASLWRQMVCLPTIFYRLNSFLLASELRDEISQKASIGIYPIPLDHQFPALQFNYNLEKLDYVNVIQPNEDTVTNPELVSFKSCADVDKWNGPSPVELLQALTMSNANDFFNLERLETIGDSFLKFAITIYLYRHHPGVHEGKLSYLRSKQVSNYNLYRLGKRIKLPQFMIASKFEPGENWLPPAFIIEQNGNYKEVNNVAYYLQTQHSLPDKSIADCVEAIIGCYLNGCGQEAALRLMAWIGLKVYSNTELIPSPLLTHISDSSTQLNNLLDGFDEFEYIIQYKFNDRAYLLQAFTHAGYHYNNVTDCYQRLEFLGDAVLDYVITRHLFEDERQHSPGILTDLRSALVNNNMFAWLAVSWDYHKFFRAISPQLFDIINKFVKWHHSHANKILHDDNLGLETEDNCEAEDIEIPKALGDIFESVAGAIYLDSSMSLDVVWKVYFRLMKDQIDAFTESVPKSPVRELLEQEPETAKFERPERTLDGKIRVTVNIIGKGIYKGIGRNYRIAKNAAARRALKEIRILIENQNILEQKLCESCCS